MISLILLLVVTGVAIFVDPVVMGFGFILFLAGIPLYVMQKYIYSKGYVHQGMPAGSEYRLLFREFSDASGWEDFVVYICVKKV